MIKLRGTKRIGTSAVGCNYREKNKEKILEKQRQRAESKRATILHQRTYTADDVAKHKELLKKKRRLLYPLGAKSDDTQHGGNMCRERAELLRDFRKAQ